MVEDGRYQTSDVGHLLPDIGYQTSDVWPLLSVEFWKNVGYNAPS